MLLAEVVPHGSLVYLYLLNDMQKLLSMMIFFA